jgi:hypothetical protein
MPWYDGLEIVFTILGAGALVWFGIAMGYTYMNTGTKNNTMDPSLSHEIGLIIGVAFLGTLILAVGLIVITYQWVDIWSKALIGMLFGFLALALTVTAMSIASITH